MGASPDIDDAEIWTGGTQLYFGGIRGNVGRGLSDPHEIKTPTYRALCLSDPYEIKTPTYRALCAVSSTMFGLNQDHWYPDKHLWIPRIKRGTSARLLYYFKNIKLH